MIAGFFTHGGTAPGGVLICLLGVSWLWRGRRARKAGR